MYPCLVVVCAGYAGICWIPSKTSVSVCARLCLCLCGEGIERAKRTHAKHPKPNVHRKGSGVNVRGGTGGERGTR